MPLFEFVCNQCEHDFEELLHSVSNITEVTCPGCGSEDVSKKISAFASRSSGNNRLSLNSNSSSRACSTGST